MKTKNNAPDLQIMTAANGLIVRTKSRDFLDGRAVMCEPTDTHVFNNKDDLFAFIEEHFVVQDVQPDFVGVGKKIMEKRHKNWETPE